MEGALGREVGEVRTSLPPPRGAPSVQPQVAEAQRGAREKRWDPPTLNKCLKTHGEWSLYFSPLDRHQGSSCRNGGVLVFQEPVL